MKRRYHLRKLQHDTLLASYTTEQVLDYMMCPLCYHLKHVQQLPLPKSFSIDSHNVYYQEAMYETIRYFYMEMQKKKAPTYKKLCDKFYKSWLERTDTVDTMSILTRDLDNASVSSRSIQSKYVPEGYKVLKQFYIYNQDTKQAILAVNEPYNIRIADADFSGNFQVIREVLNPSTKLREIQLVEFQLGRIKPALEDLNKNIELLTMGIGFKEMFKIQPDKFVVYYPAIDEEFILQQQLNDYKRTLQTLNAFRMSVEVIPPYRRPGGHPASAPYADYCEKHQY